MFSLNNSRSSESISDNAPTNNELRGTTQHGDKLSPRRTDVLCMRPELKISEIGCGNDPWLSSIKVCPQKVEGERAEPPKEVRCFDMLGHIVLAGSAAPALQDRLSSVEELTCQIMR